MRYNIIKSFDVGISINNFTGSFGKLFIYKEGIEIRFFFKSYFVPYEKITMLNSKKSLMGDVLKIEINLVSLPNLIEISSSENEDILFLISDSVSNVNIGYNKNQNSEKDKYHKLKNFFKFNEKEIYYNARIMIGLVLSELLLVFAIGPITIFYKQSTFNKTQYHTLYKNNEYTPLDKSKAPKKYSLVEVITNNKQEITNEIYYIINSEIINNRVINGTYKSSTHFILSSYIFAFFGIVGFILTAVGMQINETLAIYGMTMFFCTIAIGFIHWLINMIVFPFW